MAARPGSQIRLREGGSVETLDGAVDDSFLCQVRGLKVAGVDRCLFPVRADMLTVR